MSLWLSNVLFKSRASWLIAGWERESPVAKAGKKVTSVAGGNRRVWLCRWVSRTTHSACLFQPRTGMCRQGKFRALIACEERTCLCCHSKLFAQNKISWSIIAKILGWSTSASSLTLLALFTGRKVVVYEGVLPKKFNYQLWRVYNGINGREYKVFCLHCYLYTHL